MFMPMENSFAALLLRWEWYGVHFGWLRPSAIPGAEARPHFDPVLRGAEAPLFDGAHGRLVHGTEQSFAALECPLFC